MESLGTRSRTASSVFSFLALIVFESALFVCCYQYLCEKGDFVTQFSLVL